jgi:hypothetical protein
MLDLDNVVERMLETEEEDLRLLRRFVLKV